MVLTLAMFAKTMQTRIRIPMSSSAKICSSLTAMTGECIALMSPLKSLEDKL